MAEDEGPEIRAEMLRPRSLADWGVYVLSAVAGPAVWFSVVAVTGAEEAWDEDLWWAAMLASALVLGLLLGSSGLPYVDDPAPIVGFPIAALLFLTQIPCAIITSAGGGVSFLPVTLVVFLPLFTVVGGAVATAGVLANVGARRLLRGVS
jgi:hypothetical protein